MFGVGIRPKFCDFMCFAGLWHTALSLAACFGCLISAVSWVFLVGLNVVCYCGLLFVVCVCGGFWVSCFLFWMVCYKVSCV